jgi:DNA-binding XRE family transcriptional regulator
MKIEKYELLVKRWIDVKKMRKERYSQKFIANKYKITRQAISLIELGKKPQKPKHLCLDNECVKSHALSGRDRSRMQVRSRDKFTCQDCGLVRTPSMAKKEKKRLFDVHHLNGLCGKQSRGYDKVSEIDGLITLCHKCHFNHPEHSRNNK